MHSPLECSHWWGRPLIHWFQHCHSQEQAFSAWWRKKSHQIHLGICCYTGSCPTNIWISESPSLVQRFSKYFGEGPNRNQAPWCTQGSQEMLVCCGDMCLGKHPACQQQEIRARAVQFQQRLEGQTLCERDLARQFQVGTAAPSLLICMSILLSVILGQGCTQTPACVCMPVCV